MTPPHLKLTVYTIASQSASQCLMVVRELQRQTIREHIEVIVVTPNRNGLDESEFAVFIFAAWYFEQISVKSMQEFAFMLAFLLAGYVVYTTLRMNLLWRQHRAYLKLQQAEKTPSSLD